MTISLVESRTVTDIASHLYNFLPGKPHPYADQSISFRGVAQKVGVGQFWNDGSKLPALSQLLHKTIEFQRNKFCDLIIEIVRSGLIYRANKSDPINQEEIRKLNELLLNVQFKIPELWDPAFLDSLPSLARIKNQTPASDKIEKTEKLKERLVELSRLNPQARGFAFEKFLNELFVANDLSPRVPYRLVGEQIDGSFQLGQDVYLVEAKWQDAPTGQADLLIFHGKVEGKSTWSRGLFVSNSGFTEDGIAAFSRGRPTNMIGMTGQDIFFILNGEMPLREAIDKKARRAAETGEFYTSVFELIHHG